MSERKRTRLVWNWEEIAAYAMVIAATVAFIGWAFIIASGEWS